jgi:hypothetical protein
MAYVVISPDQFRYLEDALHSNKTVTDFQETGNYTGIITTHDVTIDYTYDPLKQMLNFNLGAKHSLAAKIAGDNVIDNHIVALIHGLTYPVPVEEPAKETLVDAQNTAAGTPTTTLPVNADLTAPVA